MKFIRYDLSSDLAHFEITKEETGFLLQAMNEVCNGIDIADSEFESRLGYRRSKGEPIMDQLAAALSTF